jgi:ActR/RegA family two-component response regulator
MTHRSSSSGDLTSNRAERDKPVVLVVDDDIGMRQTVAEVAKLHAIRLRVAADGASAIAEARLGVVDLALVDYRLGDMSGLDAIRSIRRNGIEFSWLLMSGWMTVEIAVEAMKLGALDARSLPFDIETTLLSALAAKPRLERDWPVRPIASRLKVPASAAERWVTLVLRACDGNDDLATERTWASSVCVSCRTLTACCEIVNLIPHDARNFTRVFRALLIRNGYIKNLGLSFMVSDSRTLRALLERAGLATLEPTARISPSDFFQRQRFIDPDHEILDVLRHAIAHLSYYT